MEQAKDQPKIVAIVGPTASGKTALGEALALRFEGEIVSADSKQVYIGMDIGTAKETLLKVPQHLVSIRKPGKKMTVYEFQQEAYRVIEDIRSRGKVPFLVGGSMLYAESVTAGYEFEADRKDSSSLHPRYEVLQLGIAITRETLRERIEKRTAGWIEAGLLEEIQRLLESGVSPQWLEWCGQEYRFFTKYLLGEIPFEEAIVRTNRSINQYVKRQYTWWRHHGSTIWIRDEAEAIRLVEAFLT